MSKDQAMGRLIRLAEQCNADSLVKLCDELEDHMQVEPYGAYSLCELSAIIAGASADSPVDRPRAVRQSALRMVASGL